MLQDMFKLCELQIKMAVCIETVAPFEDSHDNSISKDCTEISKIWKDGGGDLYYFSWNPAEYYILHSILV